MSLFVQDILNIIEASTKLKYEDEKVEKLQITVSFKWSTGDVFVDIIGETLEVIAEDLDNSITKNTFMRELIEELRRFALKHILAEVRVMDLDFKSMVFHTKSCFSFRDKVVDLTGLNVLKIFEIITQQPEAQLFFFYTSEKFNYFFTCGNFNSAARNSMSTKLNRENFEGMSFVCYVKLTDQNDLKKCVEMAMYKLNSHYNHIPAPMFSESELKKVENITYRKKPRSVVDLTFDDSDPEDFQENLIEEFDDDIYYEAQTSDIYNSFDDASPQMYEILCSKWKDHAIQYDEWLKNEEYEETFLKNYPDDIHAIKNGCKPRIIDDEVPKKIEKPPVVVKSPKLEKLSFSSGNIPFLMTRKKIPLIEAKPVPSNEPMRLAPTLSLIPKLNRGVSEKIDLKPSVPKKQPNSKLFSPDEVETWQKSKLHFNPISKLQELQRDGLKNYTIPKNSNQSLEINANHPKGPSPRKPINGGIRYNEIEPSINPKQNEALRKFMEITKKLEPYESPTSIKNFINNSPEKKKSKITITVEDGDEDDDVTLIESDHEKMEVDENHNSKSQKRGLFDTTDTDYRFINSTMHKKFFKNRENTQATQVRQYKSNNIKRSTSKDSKEDTNEFYNRKNCD